MILSWNLLTPGMGQLQYNHHFFHSFNPLGPVLHTSTANDTEKTPDIAQLMPSNPNRRKKTTKRPLRGFQQENPLNRFFGEIRQKACHHRDKWESTHRIFFVRYTVGLVGIRYLFFEAGKITTLNLSRGKVGLFGTKKTHVDMEKTRIEIILGQESSYTYTLCSWATPWFLLDLGSFLKLLGMSIVFTSLETLGQTYCRFFSPVELQMFLNQFSHHAQKLQGRFSFIQKLQHVQRQRQEGGPGQVMPRNSKGHWWRDRSDRRPQ